MNMSANSEAMQLSDAEVAARVEAILARLTLADKVGQLTQVGAADFCQSQKPRM